MSDEQDKAEPEQQPVKRSLIDGAPMGFIRGGGTPTMKSEQHFEQLYRDAEVRRDEAQLDLDDARKGDGRVYANQFTGHPEVPKAYVLLRYLTRGGEETGIECLGDILMGVNEDRPDEIALVLVCPRCMRQGQKHQQDCQLRIRQSKKYIVLKPAMGAPTFEFEGKFYNSAGVITETDKCKCPDCGFTFRIDHNRVWPD